MVLVVINRNDNPAYKLAWVVCIMLIPTVGGVLYLIFGRKRTTRQMANTFQKIEQDDLSYLPDHQDLIQKIEAENPHCACQARAIFKTTKHSVFVNTVTDFLSPGEEKFHRMLIDLQKAEKFILVSENFLIKEKAMLYFK